MFPALAAGPRTRFAGAVALVFALYVALDALQLEATGWIWRAGVDLATVAAPVPAAVPRDTAAEAARGLTPRHQVAAWRVGYRHGLASQLAMYADLNGHPELLPKARSFFDDALDDAALLGLAPEQLQPLRAQTTLQMGRAQQRIEADESGLAARVQAASTAWHRHLFMAGAFAGMMGYTRAVAPELDASVGATGFERHARMAGLPETLWRPVVRPPGATAQQRVAAAKDAEGRLEAALAAGLPAAPTAR